MLGLFRALSGTKEVVTVTGDEEAAFWISDSTHRSA